MINKISDNWVLVALKNVVRHTKGKKPKTLNPSPDKGLIPYIDIRAFESNQVRQYADIKSANVIKERDILIVWDGARSGLVGQGQSGAIGSTIMALTPIYVNSKYLFRFLQSQYDYINSNPRGTGIPHVDPNIFWNINFPVAPSREQERIVVKLEKLLAKVDNCKERLAKIPLILKRFRQAIIAAACSGALTMDWRKENSDLISEVNLLSVNKTKTKRKEFDQPEYFIGIWQDHEIPETWKWVLLSDVAESRLGKMLDKKKNTGHPTKYLRNVNVRWFSFELSDLLEIKASKDELQKLSLEKGDVLVCEGGEPGRAAVWNDDIKGIIYQKAIHRIRLKGNILPQWLVLNLKNDSNNKKIENLFTGTTIKHLTGQSIAKYPFSVPPLKEQNEIVRRVESLFALADQIEARYQNARNHVDHLAQSILAKAFRGELVPQDPNDPPASELLKQIQAEREKQPELRKAGKRGPTHQRRARPKA
jgi:type I restriction enzyme S subunit